MKIQITLILFCLLNLSIAQAPLFFETNQLLEDLDTLSSLIYKKHVYPDWANSGESLTRALENARTTIQDPSLSQEVKLTTFLKVVATLQDGHSAIQYSSRYDVWGYLPFTTAWFGDDLHITRIEAGKAKALGGKVLRIGEMPVEKAMAALKTVVPHANKSRFKKFSPYYLHLPGVLYGLGITDSPEGLSLEIENREGEISSFFLRASTGKDPVMADLEIEGALPLYLQQSEKDYWFTYLEEERMVYCNYRRVSTNNEESIWAFAERLFDFIEKHPVDKMVLDIRQNGGGSFPFAAPIWHGIKSSPKINRNGSLFVFTSYPTFSAAVLLANQLEVKTKAIFVGEAPCDRPNSPGDNRNYILPNTKIEVGLSSLFHFSTFYQDERKNIEPDHPIVLTFDDYMAGMDPFLDFVKKYKVLPTEKTPKNAMEMLGAYAFSPDKRLYLSSDENQLEMEISKSVYSPLYPVGSNTFKTEIKDFEVAFIGKNSLEITYPDGKKRVIKRIDDPSPTPLELIYAGDFQSAAQAYSELKQAYPDLHSLRDNNLAAAAIQVYYDIKSMNGREAASEAARALLEIAIEINDGNAPFAKESLKYY